MSKDILFDSRVRSALEEVERVADRFDFGDSVESEQTFKSGYIIARAFDNLRPEVWWEVLYQTLLTEGDDSEENRASFDEWVAKTLIGG
jgi:hypothetical protein